MKAGIIGQEKEFELMLHALEKGIPVILEGEAGTGKTEMSKAAANLLNRKLFRVDGDQEVSSLKIQGWFDPPLVVNKGYGWEAFIPGPLSNAMMEGGIFFFNEVNRAPSEAINSVLTALDERIINIPRLGTIASSHGFVAVFTCNPLDRVGTNPLPQAFFDRCIWVKVDHLPLDDTIEVVRLKTGEKDEMLINLICRIVEGSRKHPSVVSGGSIRGCIFMVKLAQAYRSLGNDPLHPDLLLSMAKSALLKKIRLRYDSELSEEEVLEDIVYKTLGMEMKKKILSTG